MGIRVETQFGVAQDLIDRLDAGDLDLAIATLRIPRKTIAYQQVYRETFVLVGVPKWTAMMPSAAASRRQAATALAHLPWLSYGAELPIVRRYFRHVFRAEPPTEASQIIPDLRALMEACIAGAGVTVLPYYLCQSRLDAGALVLLQEPSVPPGNDIFLAWNRLGLRQPRNVFVRDQLLQAACKRRKTS